MHELTQKELYDALSYARSLDEVAGRAMLSRFQREQPALSQTFFALFPSAIAEKDQEMAHFFMDLCFDVLCVFEKTFGALPPQHTLDMKQLEKQVKLASSELQSFHKKRAMNDKLRDKLQERSVQRAQDEIQQTDLVKLMNEAIDDFASENSKRAPAVAVSQALMLSAIRLLGNFYTLTPAHQN